MLGSGGTVVQSRLHWRVLHLGISVDSSLHFVDVHWVEARL